MGSNLPGCWVSAAVLRGRAAGLGFQCCLLWDGGREVAPMPHDPYRALHRAVSAASTRVSDTKQKVMFCATLLVTRNKASKLILEPSFCCVFCSLSCHYLPFSFVWMCIYTPVTCLCMIHSDYIQYKDNFKKPVTWFEKNCSSTEALRPVKRVVLH